MTGTVTAVELSIEGEFTATRSKQDASRTLARPHRCHSDHAAAAVIQRQPAGSRIALDGVRRAPSAAAEG